ncbi:MAG: hypothetical protein GXP16_13180 [Gammaproteobacteria bacterium]|nr:hypothetical protein [Gammaproteobacteria bacterium]
MRDVAALLISTGLLCACSHPMGPVAGGKLEGELTPWTSDWTFSDSVEYIFLETNPTDPYSVTLWGVHYGDNFYVAAANQESTWAANIQQDAKIVLLINDKLFKGRAQAVTAADEFHNVIAAYLKKYDIETEEDFAEEDGMLYRLTAR